MQNDTPNWMFHSNHHCEFTNHEWTRASVPSSHRPNILSAEKLTNRIHPLFDQPLKKAVDDFSVVEQSARLATQFVECGLLHRLFLAIANEGKPGRAWGETGREEDKYERVGLEIPHSELITTKKTDGRRAQELLKHLSQSITYALDSATKDHGATESIQDKHFIDSKFPNGEKSKVKIAASLYEDLKKAQGTEDTPYLFYLQVNLAITLVHEIGHAVDNLAHGKLWHGHFLGENIIREAGFDIETRLFGGHLTTLFGSKTDPNAITNRYYHERRPSALRGILVLFEYPYQSLATLYAHHESHMEIRKQPRDVRELDVAWRVPIPFLGKLFCDGFWRDELPSNPTALRPECSVGYTFRTDSNGNSIPVKKHKDDKTMMYVPKGYRRVKDDGSVVRYPNSSDGLVNTTKFWDSLTESYLTGDRPWVAKPYGYKATDLPCEHCMDDVETDSDTEIVDQ